MCGIVGVINASGKDYYIDRKNIEEMRDELIHRGPDDMGSFFDRNVGLGFRRLAILDLSANGHQPMTYKSFTIVFNGEIFNFQDIKKELIGNGHKFISTCDTEVILHAYEEWGVESVNKFNGMFAYAIYDSKRRKVVMVRDRLGIKPLYYSKINSKVMIFGSEIKALCKYRYYVPSLDRKAAYDFFRYSYVPGEDTMFESIKSLLPGHYLEYDLNPNDIAIKKYWDLPDRACRDSFDEAIEKIDALLDESVRLRLISDVPVGVQLSGGVDSSLVANYASKHSPNIYAISINVDDATYSEKSYAEFVAKKLHLKFHSIDLDSETFFTDMDRLLYLYGEPTPHANSIGIYLLSRYAKDTVSVLLSGEGADELFCGYDRYVQMQAYRSVAKLPSKRLRRKAALSKLGDCYYSYLVDIQKEPLDDFYIENLHNPYKRSELDEITFGKYAKSTNTYINELLRNTNGKDLLDRASRYDMKTYLVALLQRQDRMSMAFSVENRVPFLDYRLVEYVVTLPSSYKVKKGKGKYILKELAQKYYPQDFVYRPKQGFGLPLKALLGSPKGKKIMKSILKEGLITEGLFDADKLQNMLNNAVKGEEVNTGLLWLTIAFEKWARLYFDKKNI